MVRAAGTRLLFDTNLQVSCENYELNESADNGYDVELKRVISHGLLHLCGIDDKGPGEREIMEAAENRALAMRSK